MLQKFLKVPKRKAPTSFDISKVKKSDSIKKRSQALIDSLSGNLPSEQDFDLDDFLAGGGHAQLEAENFNQEQVRIYPLIIFCNF